MKRILFCTPAPLTKSLGAPKVVVELAEEMQHLGWDCKLVSIYDLAKQTGRSMPEAMRFYLQEHAADYDVIDYDHEYLPYPRSDFKVSSLFVARSVLLTHHLETISIPHAEGVRSIIGNFLNGRKRRQRRQEMVRNAQCTIEEADLVNVSNQSDKEELIKYEIPPEKLLVLPYGISRARRQLFDQVSSTPPTLPKIAFIGTFDFRKGAKEFPNIVEAIVDKIEDVTFHMLGVKGLYSTAQKIREQFPKGLRHKVEVTLSYAPEELPKLLSSCSVGVFPSYMEGFPFGVLEMLAASIPVAAYNSPGPPMMLPTKLLAPRGDWRALSDIVVALLQSKDELHRARIWSKQQSQQFCWTTIARDTDAAYCEHIYRNLGI